MGLEHPMPAVHISTNTSILPGILQYMDSYLPYMINHLGRWQEQGCLQWPSFRGLHPLLAEAMSLATLAILLAIIEILI